MYYLGCCTCGVCPGAGLVFLSSKPSVMMGMVRTLTQQAVDDNMLPLTVSRGGQGRGKGCG